MTSPVGSSSTPVDQSEVATFSCFACNSAGFIAPDPNNPSSQSCCARTPIRSVPASTLWQRWRMHPLAHRRVVAKVCQKPNDIGLFWRASRPSLADHTFANTNVLDRAIHNVQKRGHARPVARARYRFHSRVPRSFSLSGSPSAFRKYRGQLTAGLRPLVASHLPDLCHKQSSICGLPPASRSLSKQPSLA